ncbi:MAG TPA: orotidine 5'-phosphate decarboxylase / HUMPS family protein, partial [Patescibacteria group bacterium]|nr:orotidine 5'-phosphate decarboxylase / HUMPS family protein [Patescibacteria group bacterium]
MAKKLPCFFLANDASSEGKAFRNAEQVANVEGPYGMKLNLDLVTKDWSIIRRMGDFTGRPIFVDMKMWNGKRTMAEIVQAVADEGGAMVNAYASAERLLEKASEVARDTGVVLLGVTVLTHYDDAYCRRIYRRSMNDTVRMFAEMSMRWGCNGYILPGTTL